MKKITIVGTILGLFSSASAHAASALGVSAAASHPVLGILIPGLGVDIKTKTVIGWALALGIVYSAYRVYAAFNKANDERDKEKRAEDIKMAWITFGSILGVTAVLTATGLVSFTDMSTALNAF